MRDRIFFAKQLSVLLAADVPLLESLEIIRSRSRSRGVAMLLSEVIEDARNGKSLSRSLARHTGAFGEFTIAVIAVGEASGTLSTNLEYLAQELLKRYELRRKVFAALLYPMLIAGATLVLTGFLILYLFPKLMPMFLSLDMQLPLSTRVVMSVSAFLTHYGLVLFVAIAVFFILLHIARIRVPRIDDIVHRTFLMMPILATCIKQYNIAQGMRSLGLLLASGMSLPHALRTLADLAHNLLYKKEWLVLARAVDRGEAMSECMQHRPDLFIGMLPHMVAVGERSGDLSKCLIYAADAAESEFEEYTKFFSTLLEPILMISLGLLVGIVAISIITPIYGLTQHLQS